MTWDEAIGAGKNMTITVNTDPLKYTPDTVSNIVINSLNKKYGVNQMRYGTDFLTTSGTITGTKKYFLTTKEEDMTILVKKIIRSGPCTIVIWWDGEKTIVRKSEDDPDDEYAAFCAAFCKRFFGSTSAVKKLIDKKTVPYMPTNKEKKDGLNKGGR